MLLLAIVCLYRHRRCCDRICSDGNHTIVIATAAVVGIQIIIATRSTSLGQTKYRRHLQKQLATAVAQKGGLPMCARMGAIIDGLGLGVSSGFV